MKAEGIIIMQRITMEKKSRQTEKQKVEKLADGRQMYRRCTDEMCRLEGEREGTDCTDKDT